MPRPHFTSVKAYIASKPREARVALERVRKAIRRAVPDAEESLSYRMPAYTLNGVPVLYFRRLEIALLALPCERRPCREVRA